VKTIKFLLGLAIAIAIENTRRSDNISYLLSNIHSSSLGFCFDSSHHFLTDKQDFSLLDSFGERLVTTHLSDNDGLQDRHWIPGQGIIDWAMLAKRFPLSYEGCLTLEAYPTAEQREESPQIFLKKAYQKVKNMSDLIEAASNGLELLWE